MEPRETQEINFPQPQPVQPKPIWKSKTYGFGAILAALGLAIFGLPELQALLESLPAEYYGAASLVVSVVVFVLRKLTTGPAEFKFKIGK